MIRPIIGGLLLAITCCEVVLACLSIEPRVLDKEKCSSESLPSMASSCPIARWSPSCKYVRACQQNTWLNSFLLQLFGTGNCNTQRTRFRYSTDHQWDVWRQANLPVKSSNPTVAHKQLGTSSRYFGPSVWNILCMPRLFVGFCKPQSSLATQPNSHPTKSKGKDESNNRTASN